MFSLYREQLINSTSGANSLELSDTVSESSDNATLISLSKEDLRIVGAGDIREDVRVSRKKLETLILREREMLSSDCKTFMDSVMDRTETYIQWPSKMKIGAKTKKDLYVRIYGHSKESVNGAIQEIMAELGPHRDLRITLKMEISYTDHSHLIGCRGATIRRVMEDTGCHIHFPDSNRMSKDQKSNQVTIAGGSIQAVEQARSRVRELSPLIFQFSLPTMQFDPKIPDTHLNFIGQLETAYNVSITIHPPNKMQQTTISIKGCEVDAPRIKEAIVKLANYFSGTNNNTFHMTVESTMEISPPQHSFVRSVNDSNCHTIMMNTGAKIVFPDLSDPNIQQIKRSRVLIVGDINAVHHARQQLIGCLPLRMIFDVSDDYQLDWDNIRNTGTDLNVSIKLINRNNRGSNPSLPPPLPGRSRTIQIIACERNTTNIYEARKRILNAKEDLIVNVPAAYSLNRVYRGPPAGAFGQTPSGNHPNNSTPQAPTRLNLQPLMLPPMSPSMHSPVLSPCFWPPTPFASPFCSPTVNNIMPSYTSPRYESANTSAVQSSANNTLGSQASMAMSPPESSMESSITSSGGRSKAPGWERVNNQSSTSDDLNTSGNTSLNSSFMHMSLGSGNNNMPPGPPGLSSAGAGSLLSNASSLTAADKKYMALKAIHQSKISAGVPRVPNSDWAGLYFSKTNTNLFAEHGNTDLEMVPEEKFNSFANNYRPAANKPHLLHTQQSNLLEFAPNADSSQAKDLAALFLQNGLDKYIDTFMEEEIDLEAFKTLVESDLRSLGVSSYPARKKMLLLIAQFGCYNNNTVRPANNNNNNLSCNNNNNVAAKQDLQNSPQQQWN